MLRCGGLVVYKWHRICESGACGAIKEDWVIRSSMGCSDHVTKEKSELAVIMILHT